MYFSRSSEIVLLPVENIVPNIKQPRKTFDLLELESLSKSITENGLLQPITVRPSKNGDYEIVAGERRYRACIMAGITNIPSMVIESSEEQAVVLSLTESVQRRNLNCFEEAKAIKLLMRNYSYSYEYIASILGKPASSISNMLDLLTLTDEIQSKLVENDLSQSYAEALLRLSNEKDIERVTDTVISKKLSVAQTNELIDRIAEGKKTKKERKTRMFFKDLRIFINTLDHAVSTMNNSGIQAQKEQYETDSYIRYTVTIPKTTHTL